ncbi:MAG TPA: hypothetical protein ENL27_00025 [Candidatus Parcubacteria bacterium]|nr:hypothetical protein [Candidatus Parcubacteria bacterium]
MPRRKLSERNIRKLTKMGGGKSFGITFPISFIRELGWRERQKLKVEFDKKRKRIIVRDWE